GRGDHTPAVLRKLNRPGPREALMPSESGPRTTLPASPRPRPRPSRGGTPMSQPHPRNPSIHRIDRRAFLKGATGGAVAVAGLEGILAARRAPAFAQTVELKVLQWVDFIPEGDVELRRLYAEYSEQMKVKVTLETINANDLQARITAAIQSGAGPDVIMMLHNWPHLYQNGLADVSELCEWKGKE